MAFARLAAISGLSAVTAGAFGAHANVLPFECNAQGKFFAKLKFKVTNPVSDRFILKVNGIMYETPAYGKELYEIGPFAGDCSTLYKFLVQDIQNSACQDDYVFTEKICCNSACKIYDPLISFSACEEGKFNLRINFSHINTLLKFRVKINGVTKGRFNYSDLPVIIEKLNEKQAYEVIIWDVEQEACRLSLNIPAIECTTGTENVWSSNFTLARTRDTLNTPVSELIRGKKIDDDLLEELETTLLMADCGVAATNHLLEGLRARVKRERIEDPEALRKVLEELLTGLLRPLEQPLDTSTHKPFIVMLAGVNGSQDHFHRQTGPPLSESGQIRAAGGGRHLPCRRPGATGGLGRTQRRHRHRPGRGGPGGSDLRRRARRQGARHRHRAGGHRRTPAHPKDVRGAYRAKA